MSLPRTYRTYFDPYCTEYTLVRVETKLLELGDAIMHGFDVHEAVKEILNKHTQVSEDNVHSAICRLLAEVSEEKTSYLQLLRRGNSLDADIDLFVERLREEYPRLSSPSAMRFLNPLSSRISRGPRTGFLL